MFTTRSHITLIYLDLKSEDDLLTNELKLNKDFFGSLLVEEMRFLYLHQVYYDRHLLCSWQLLI